MVPALQETSLHRHLRPGTRSYVQGSNDHGQTLSIASSCSTRVPIYTAAHGQWTADVMCRYRYYYFAHCRHQQTVLLEFCTDAQDLPTSDTSASSDVDMCSDGAGKWYFDQGRANAATERAPVEDNNDDLHSLCSTTSAHQTSFSSGDSLDTELLLGTAESSIEYSSFLADHSSHSSCSSPESPLPTSMAGLPLFAGTFKSWMSGAQSSMSMHAATSKMHASENNHHALVLR